MRTLVLLVALLLSACDTINVQQYRIAGGVRHDTAQVQSILHGVATQTGLADSTSTSRTPRTLVFYTQPDVQHFRVDIGARTFGDDILVDLNGGFGPARPEFKRAKRLLTLQLTQAFGSRLSLADFAHQVPINPQ